MPGSIAFEDGELSRVLSESSTASALVSALRLASESGGAQAALRAAGIELPSAASFEGLDAGLLEILGPDAGEGVDEAMALGFLAGRVARRPSSRSLRDPTFFILDEHLVVIAAEGESILRLPWIDEGLFVGRQLPDIHEIPNEVRDVAVDNYEAALKGTPGRYSFLSYGHAYTVDALPVRPDDDGVTAVLAVAIPDEPIEPRRRAADTSAPVDRGSITRRETEVLSLASMGLTQDEIADELSVAPSTIKSHLSNSYRKLGVPDKASAVAAALRLGLIR